MSESGPDDEDALRIASFLCFTIYSTTHAFNRVYQPLLREIGLTYPQYLVMVTLWERETCTVGSICQILQLESSTLTPLLKRLESLGHIERYRDARDERQVRVALTERGRSLKSEATRIPKCILEASGQSAGELADLQQRIETLRTALLAHNAEKGLAKGRKVEGDAPESETSSSET